jgi:hypothetical protein
MDTLRLHCPETNLHLQHATINEGQPSSIVRREREAFVAALLPVLLQGGGRHWSQSVNTLRGRALRVLHELDADAFDVRLPPS